MPSRQPTSPLHPTTCEACDAAIWFRPVTTRGAATPPKLMPIDAEPNPAGNIAAYPERHWLPARILLPPEQPADGEVIFMPHWRTCTNPKAFRRRDTARRRAETLAVREPGTPAQPALFPAHDTQEATRCPPRSRS